MMTVVILPYIQKYSIKVKQRYTDTVTVASTSDNIRSFIFYMNRLE